MSKFKITINGKTYEVAVSETGKDTADVEISGKRFSVQVEREEFSSSARPSAPAAPGKPSGSKGFVSKAIRSPLPGNVIKVFVNVGQAVKRGDTLVTIESMKMENSIVAEVDGIVNGVRVAPGQSVMPGDILVDFGTEKNQAAESPAEKPQPKAPASKKTVVSPLPGTVLKVMFEKGAKVKRGDTVLTVESMKMENSIMAERDGVLSEIFVKAGQNLMQGEPLFELD